MEELKILLEECVCEKLIHMTASGARDKHGISKVRIRPVLQKGSLMFQSAARKGKQEFHSNRDRDEHPRSAHHDRSFTATAIVMS